MAIDLSKNNFIPPPVTLQSVKAEADMLEGNINRMFLTDDLIELNRMREFAILRLEKIYDFHLHRVQEK